MVGSRGCSGGAIIVAAVADDLLCPSVFCVPADTPCSARTCVHVVGDVTFAVKDWDGPLFEVRYVMWRARARLTGERADADALLCSLLRLAARISRVRDPSAVRVQNERRGLTRLWVPSQRQRAHFRW